MRDGFMYTVILLFMVMPQNLKQKLFLFFGIFIAGILGVVTSYSRYVKMTVSKEDSLFGATVYADVPVGGDPGLFYGRLRAAVKRARARSAGPLGKASDLHDRLPTH
jgi:hypothetical protein